MDQLLNRAPCGFLSFSDDGKVELVNETLLDLLGYAREELVGRHVENILTVATRIFYQTHLFPLLRLHGRADEIFLMLRSRGGEQVGVLLNAAGRESERQVVYDCVLMQVRERQKYEDELLRARRAAEQAQAESESHQQELQQVNEQLQAQALELELQQEQLEQQAADLEAASEDLRLMNEELRSHAKEADELRAGAEEANRAKSTFLAVMSHELRTPLNAIAGYVEIMAMGIHGPVTDTQLDTLARITRSQRHLLRLINDVLNLARIESGRVEYLDQDVRIAETLAAVSPMIEPQLAMKRISYEVQVPPDLLVRGDPEKIEQILLNLLGNAAKFTEPGGRIRVDAVASPHAPGKLLVRVQDTGIGIPTAKVGAIFDPFVQVDASATRSSEGSGLGLAISRDLARGMGGDITATSTLAKGSTFTLTLPVRQQRTSGVPDPSLSGGSAPRL